MIAQQEAHNLGCQYVGSELLLLGVVGQGSNLASSVLKDAGLTFELVFEDVEKVLGQQSGTVPVEIPFTPKAKQVLEQAVNAAQQLNIDYVGPEHLLLAFVSTADNAAANILRNLGADPAEIRKRLIRVMDEKVAVPAGKGRGAARLGGGDPVPE